MPRSPLNQLDKFRWSRQWLWLMLFPLCWGAPTLPASFTDEALAKSAPTNRGVQSVFPADSATDTGRSIVVVIGIDDYRHWQKLRNPVSDAKGVQRVLKEKFGFVAPIPPLLNEAATKASILNVVDDQLRKELKKNDRLVLFFAGHGHTRVDTIGGNNIETGFLVPVEAKTGADEQWSDYIKLDDLLQTISTLAARQVLVIFDSCHSGFAVGSSLKSFRATTRFEGDLAKRVSRRVITSAMRDQLARDDGPLPDHSLFAGLLVNGLNWGRSDLDGNGLVTSSELGLYLQQAVGQATESHQTPDFGAFNLDARGELIISLKHQTFDALKARAFNALYRGQLEDLRLLTKEASNLRPQSPEVEYLRYRLHLMDRNIPEAITNIHHLLDLEPAPGVIPLSSHGLGTLRYQLPYWESALSIQEGEAPIAIEFLSGNSEESLEVIQEKEHEGGVSMYPIKAGEIIQLKISNTSEASLHAYMMEIDTDGRVTPVRLWEDLDLLLSGIPSQTVLESLPFRDGGERGVSEWRLLTSPIRLNMLAAPPSTATRGIVHPFEAPDGVRVKTIRYFATP